MKLVKAAVPYLLAVLIAAIGIYTSRVIEQLSPTYMDTITVYDKTASSSSLYIGGEELLIYPWNQYSEENTYARVKEYSGDDLLTSLILQTIDEFSGSSRSPQDTAEFFEAIEQDTSFFYIRNCEYEAKDGNDYICNMALTLDYCLVYYHLEPAAPQTITDDIVQEAMETIRGWSRSANSDSEAQNRELEINEDLEQEYTAELVKESTPLDRMLTHYIRVMTENSLYDVDYEDYVSGRMKEILLNSQLEILAYNNELLAVYRYNAEETLIIYYSPVSNAITGFSIQLYG